jgi:hypothetical protein
MRGGPAIFLIAAIVFRRELARLLGLIALAVLALITPLVTSWGAIVLPIALIGALPQRTKASAHIRPFVRQ